MYQKWSWFLFCIVCINSTKTFCYFRFSFCFDKIFELLTTWWIKSDHIIFESFLRDYSDTHADARKNLLQAPDHKKVFSQGYWALHWLSCSRVSTHINCRTFFSYLGGLLLSEQYTHIHCNCILQVHSLNSCKDLHPQMWKLFLAAEVAEGEESQDHPLSWEFSFIH